MEKEKEIKALRKAYRSLFDLVMRKGKPFMDIWVLERKHLKKIEKIHSKLSKIYGENKK